MGPKRLSATVASRSFARLLDEVEKGGSFVVHRRGRNICMIGPPPLPGRRASECLEILKSLPPVLLDDQFGRDMEEIIATEVVGEPPIWD